MSYDIGPKIGIDGERELRASINKINDSMRTLGSEMKLVKSRYDDGDESMESYSEQNKILNKQIDTQKEKLQMLQRGLQEANAKYGESDKITQRWQRTVNKASTDLNKMEAELKQNQSAMQKLNPETKEAAKQFEELQERASKAREELGNMKEAAKNLAVGGALTAGAMGAAAIGGIVSFADNGRSAMNSFAAQTGATKEELEEFKDVAKEIYMDNFGESMDDVANSMAEVKQITGKTGEELKEATTQALLMRDTFGFDVKESIGTVNSLMKKFHISADEAYTLIAQGAQNGANKNDDLLDILNEYSPQFSALGFSAEEFTDILIQGAKDGAFQVDKVGDAIKEFTIRSKDMSDTTADAFTALGFDASEMGNKFATGGDTAKSAFQEVISALQDIEDPIVKNQIGVELFGTMFEDLEAKSIESLGNVRRQTDRTKDTLDKINDVKYDDLTNGIEGVKRKIITEVAEPLGQELLPVVDDLVDKLAQADTGKIVDGFSFLVENASTIAAGAAAIGAGMATWKVISLVSTIVTVIKGWSLANEGLTISQLALNLAMSANPIGLVITVIAALVAGIVVLWNTNEDFRNAVIGAWNKIKEVGENVFGSIQTFFTETIPNAFNTTLDFVKNHWKDVLLFITNPVAGAIKLLYNINPRFRQWADTVKETVKNKLMAIKNVNWGEIGKAIIDGIANGVKNSASKLANSARDAAKGALTSVKDFLGIHSPSRVFKNEVGIQIGAGMAEGVQESTARVNKAVQSLNTKMAGKVGIKNGDMRDTVIHTESVITLDGKTITKATSKHQSKRNKTRSRARGVLV